MSRLTDKITEAALADRILTDVDLHTLLDGTRAARYGMVNKALKKGDLIRLRRGLYLLSNKYRHKKVSQFFLASRIVPQSYVSLESALSYYGWIPERVSRVTSILPRGPSKIFKTSFGEFSFYQQPFSEYQFLTGVVRIEEIEGEPFLLASPLRALADYVYLKKLDQANFDYLINSLRIDEEVLLKIDPSECLKLKKVYRSKRVLNFLGNLNQELRNQ